MSNLTGRLDQDVRAEALDIRRLLREVRAELDSVITPWTDFTPSWTNYTRGNGTTAGQFRYVGESMEIRVLETLGSTSVMGTAPSLAVPDGQTALDPNFFPVGDCHVVDDGVAARVCSVRVVSGGLVPYWHNPTLVAVAATVPHTWGTNDAMRLTASIRVNRA